jgi:hypothetical protein
MKSKYKAILFHPAGDFVTDFEDKKEKLDVWEAICSMGSRWIFYPLGFVATEKTVVDTPDGMEFLKGKRITTVKKYLKDVWAQSPENPELISDTINKGLPLSLVYQP